MRIEAIRELTVQLDGSIANAVVDFSSHTVSLVTIVSDQLREGKRVCGVAFNSIGRFGQRGPLTERLIPRLLAADPTALLCDDGRHLDPAAVLATALRNEKPGGHGDRAGAAAALELAAWDLNAKLDGEPAHAYIARSLGRQASPGAPVYAAGGYYYPDDSTSRLQDELRGYRDLGYTRFKIKIGGASLGADLARVEAAIDIAGDAAALAVDANARFDLRTALAYSEALAPYGLRWYEEPVDPLDYATLADVAARHAGSLATGENLFSTIDVRNLLRYANLRPDRDLLQMDPGLAYGLTEYLDMLNAAADAGFDRTRCLPHGGHLINLHVVTALGLGGCEAYPGVFQPFGGFAPQCSLQDGRLWPSDAEGFGLEQKTGLAPLIRRLTAT